MQISLVQYTAHQEHGSKVPVSALSVAHSLSYHAARGGGGGGRREGGVYEGGNSVRVFVSSTHSLRDRKEAGLAVGSLGNCALEEWPREEEWREAAECTW